MNGSIDRRAFLKAAGAGSLALGYISAVALPAWADDVEGSRVELLPGAGSGTPSATGEARVQLDGTVLNGSVRVDDLPSQAFGSGKFYGAWFVRTDTGDKAFLGALIQNSSIIFSSAGDGHLRFAATKFTNGPHAGMSISLGSKGKNLIIVLIEDKIDGRNPSPVGVAVSGTF